MFHNAVRALILSVVALVLAVIVPVASAAGSEAAKESSYVLADSIGYGLHLNNLEATLQAKLGGASRISYDGGRSITAPGNQIKLSALQSVEADRDFIAGAGVIIIILGMEQEASFAESQQRLLQKLRSIAPHARYYWVDIAATISTHAAQWSDRNKIIYDNAAKLEYNVISRYKAIFGPGADPLHIVPGQNFPGWGSESGYGGAGNVHGFDGQLSNAIMAAIYKSDARTSCGKAASLRSYVIGDSIAYGLHVDGLASKLQAKFGGFSLISYDGGRSIVSRGSQIEKSALESVELDKDFIAKANVIVIVLGTNLAEPSFDESQQLLMQNLKAIAPLASYFWVDIGATVAAQVESWNARNKIIYENAGKLGYSVISRYKAIFGPKADPLNIKAGADFPNLDTGPAAWAPDNIHGASAELSKAILDAVKAAVCKAGT